ncbi:hypothetical protein PSN45_002585 [Yamadazyma tenuis]|nr:hypothetical protein PSN45_002585 [Yamadazyma tenuis]
MNKTINNNNYASQLADDFNRFYIHITDRTLHQVGNYRIAHEIGEGSFGKAYLAHHVLLNTPVVLKSGLIDDPNIVREIYYHKQLKHRNIVRLYEVIKTETHLWLVMEYCQGNELYYLIYENRRLEYKQTQHLFFQIIQATKYVHSLNLAHRDLKLENILLADKKKSIIKLTDFGFVREFSPASRRLLSTMCGTTVYMAPEVLCGQKYNGFSADIWSLGIILYTMLYGQMPFEEDDELRTKYKIIHESPTYDESVPSAANTLIQRMLTKNPMSRPNLNDILNSPFLIDISNRFPTHSHSKDTDSALSISQYYMSNRTRFSSKVEKALLKRLAHAGVRVDRLRRDIEEGHMNSLTAFFDLSLTRDVRHKRRSRRARRSLSKSTKKMKSVLQLNEDGPQLERIMSTLSLGSRQGKADPRRSTDRRSVDVGRGSDVPSPAATAPFDRTVSFYTEHRRSSVSSAPSPAGPRPLSNPSGRKLMNRLQFWKKRDEPQYVLEDTSDLTINSPSPKTVPDNVLMPIQHLGSNGGSAYIYNQNQPYPGEQSNPKLSEVKPASKDQKPAKSSAMVLSPSASTPTKLRRPTSMVSQLSHVSQLSTMASESESEMLASDSMDEFDEELYESSSLNASTQDVGRSTARNGTTKRPTYRRQVSSDVSIASVSTSAMSRHPSTTKKAASLRQVSSNSSTESSELLSPAASTTTGTGGLLMPQSNMASFVFGRSGSPINSTFPSAAPVPRSSSPPVGVTNGPKFKGEKIKYGTTHPIQEENEDDNSS